MARSSTLLHGALDALVLKTLTWGPRHGYSIARWLQDATEAALTIEEGSLYPALYRLEERGWVSAEWGVSENNRRAKFYALTATGLAQLTAETASWSRYARAIFAALDAPALPGNSALTVSAP